MSLEIRNETGDARGAAHTLFHMAHLSKACGEHLMAEDYWQQSCQAFAEINKLKWEGQSLINLAVLRLESGRDSEAVGYLERALICVRNVGDQEQEGAVLSHLAKAYEALGQDVRARECYDEAVAIARKLGITQ